MPDLDGLRYLFGDHNPSSILSHLFGDIYHQVGDHNPSSILICCVIYDLEGSNDANPQDANLTLVGEIYFP